MASEEDARKTIVSMNSTTFLKRTLSVAEAKPQLREKRGYQGERNDFVGIRKQGRSGRCGLEERRGVFGRSRGLGRGRR